MAAFTKLTARVAPLPKNDIDTDQIIPARFLKVTDKEGLGDALFSDWRYTSEGQPNPDFPLNQERHRGAGILLAGQNFGCGSSREHAPWALLGFGFRAVLAPSFADIFHNNSLKNGLLPVQLDATKHAEILRRVQADPDIEVTIDLETQRLEAQGMEPVEFPIDSFAKRCLLQGVDQLGYLLSLEEHITAFEQRRDSSDAPENR